MKGGAKPANKQPSSVPIQAPSTSDSVSSGLPGDNKESGPSSFINISSMANGSFKPDGFAVPSSR